MAEKSRKPKIRFTGCTEDWEQRKLEEISPLRGGFPFQSNKFQDDGIPIIKISNILSTGEVGGVFDYYSELVNDDNFILPDGAAVLAMSGATTGKVAILKKTTNKIKVYQNQRVGYFEDKKLIDYSFIKTLVRSKLFINKLKSILVTGAQPNISSKDVDEFEFYIPKNNEEQIRIGTFFRHLDNLITLHQRKRELIVNIKKALLEKMFPKKGADVPEVRFAGFTEAWEQRKLGDVGTSFDYGLNAASKSFDGKNKYIRITDIDDSSRSFLQTDLTSPDTNLAQAKSSTLQEGDIVFARTGASVGKTYIYNETDGLVYFAGFLIRVRIKPEYNADFIFQNTLTKNYATFINITSQRSGQPGVNAQEYASFAFLAPSQPEQSKIGTFFRHLDHLITLHQRKVELLQNIKKACLETMFV